MDDHFRDRSLPLCPHSEESFVNDTSCEQVPPSGNDEEVHKREVPILQQQNGSLKKAFPGITITVRNRDATVQCCLHRFWRKQLSVIQNFQGNRGAFISNITWRVGIRQRSRMDKYYGMCSALPSFMWLFFLKYMRPSHC